MRKLSIVALIVGVALFAAGTDAWSGITPVSGTVYAGGRLVVTNGSVVHLDGAIWPYSQLVVDMEGGGDYYGNTIWNLYAEAGGTYGADCEVNPVLGSRRISVDEEVAGLRLYAYNYLGYLVFDNRAPEVEAGPDAAAPLGGTVTLGGSVGGEDFTVNFIGWHPGAGVDSASIVWTDSAGNVVGNTPVITVTVTKKSTEVYTLTAADNLGNTASDTVSVSPVEDFVALNAAAIAALEAAVDTELATLEAALDAGLAGLEAALDAEVAGLEVALDAEVAGLEAAIDGLAGEFESHTHVYLTGKGVGHNNTQAPTGGPIVPSP